MLLPTSSRLHSGVVLVPQLAQLRAPTADLTFFAGPEAGLSVSTPGEGASPVGVAPRAGADGDDSSAGAVMSNLPDMARALLSVGHPAQALDPPVPSHRPSPGHVPPPEMVCAPEADMDLVGDEVFEEGFG